MVQFQFQGSFEHSFDEKNRLVLPSSYRKRIPDTELKEGFTITLGRGGECLDMHPMPTWREYIDGLFQRYEETNEEAQEFLRDILAAAFEVYPDPKNYRFTIPEASKKQAGLKRDVIFVGVWRRIEIWDLERWNGRREARGDKPSPPAFDHPKPS